MATLCVSDFVDKILVQLLFQYPEIRRLFGTDERFELFEGDLVVVVRGRNLLGECIVVRSLLKILSKGSQEDIRPVFSQDRCEGVSSVNEPVWCSELDAFLLATHYVYIVSQTT